MERQSINFLIYLHINTAAQYRTVHKLLGGFAWKDHDVVIVQQQNVERKHRGNILFFELSVDDTFVVLLPLFRSIFSISRFRRFCTTEPENFCPWVPFSSRRVVHLNVFLKLHFKIPCFIRIRGADFPRANIARNSCPVSQLRAFYRIAGVAVRVYERVQGVRVLGEIKIRQYKADRISQSSTSTDFSLNLYERPCIFSPDRLHFLRSAA